MGKQLDDAVTRIEKQFGQGSIFLMGSKKIVDIPVISTGILSIDRVLGIGGIPKGRIIEISGSESGGKTTICLQIIAEAQGEGLQAAFVDAEHSLDKSYATKLGVNVDNLLLSQPDYGEQGLEIVDSLIRSNEVGIIVIDSVAALTPKSEIEGEMGDNHMGLASRMMSQALRKLTAITAKSNCIVIFINQLRDKIGVMFGANETTTGGRALKFYSSIRIDVRRTAAIKDGESIIGAKTRIKIIKNKCAAPFQECEVDLIYGEGISKTRDLVELATEFEVIHKSGAWYDYKGERLGQGLANTAAFLKQEKDLSEQIRKETWEHLK